MVFKSFQLIATILISVASFHASAAIIGDKEWSGGYIGTPGPIWNELAEIFDSTTGKCISNQCQANEIWASQSDVIQMFDIAGPNVLTLFEPTFGSSNGFEVVHGFTRDKVLIDGNWFGETEYYFCQFYGTNCGVGNGGAIPVDVDAFKYYGVAMGNWTYIPLEVVPVPATIWLFGSGLLGLVGFARRKS